MSRPTSTSGASFIAMPSELTSAAVAAYTWRTSSGSLVQPRPTSCGKMVAPRTFPLPCTASMPKSTGICMRVAEPAARTVLAMASQSRASMSSGAPPSAPRRKAAISSVDVSEVQPAIVIWPTFSSSVICERSQSTCASTSAGGPAYGAGAGIPRSSSRTMVPPWSHAATTTGSKHARARRKSIGVTDEDPRLPPGIVGATVLSGLARQRGWPQYRPSVGETTRAVLISGAPARVSPASAKNALK